MNIQSINIPSQCLKRDISINIVLPETPSGKWLLLLHGYGGDKDEWLTKSSVADFVDKYGITLILPSCCDGYYEDTQEPMGHFLGEELPTFVCKYFSLSRRREDAYICGVSMGGFGALLIGSRYSNVYGKIASFGGAFIIHDIAIGNPGVLGNADVNYFRQVFGDFSTLEGSGRDPLTHIQTAVDENRMSAVYLLCGVKDVVYQGNERIRKGLHRMGVPVKLVAIPEGGHTWVCWNPYIEQLLMWLLDKRVQID